MCCDVHHRPNFEGEDFREGGTGSYEPTTLSSPALFLMIAERSNKKLANFSAEE
jgi:hypothetical protein